MFFSEQALNEIFPVPGVPEWCLVEVGAHVLLGMSITFSEANDTHAKALIEALNTFAGLKLSEDKNIQKKEGKSGVLKGYIVKLSPEDVRRINEETETRKLLGGSAAAPTPHAPLPDAASSSTITLSLSSGQAAASVRRSEDNGAGVGASEKPVTPFHFYTPLVSPVPSEEGAADSLSPSEDSGVTICSLGAHPPTSGLPEPSGLLEYRKLSEPASDVLPVDDGRHTSLSSVLGKKSLLFGSSDSFDENAKKKEEEVSVSYRCGCVLV